jgi:hypothetical protein
LEKVVFGSKENKNQLKPPPFAEQREAVEILRVWALVGKGQQFSVQPVWKDPAAWGLLFVDLARYLAHVYEQEGMNGDQVLLRIRQAFDAEWNSPTNQPSDACEK